MDSKQDNNSGDATRDKTKLHQKHIDTSNAWVFVSHSNRDFEKIIQVRNMLESLQYRPLLFFLKCLEDDKEILVNCILHPRRQWRTASYIMRFKMVMEFDPKSFFKAKLPIETMKSVRI